MHTSFAILALAGFMVSPAPASKPDLVWWRDYQIAQDKGVKEGKPLAVFVGTGQGGYHALAQEGELNDSVKDVLAERYVCVYLDTNSASQADLIQSLAVTKGHGLVLSDRSGSVQAYHHDGTLSDDELSTQLQHFADPALEVHTTITNVEPRVSFYSGAGSSYPKSYYPPVTFARSC